METPKASDACRCEPSANAFVAYAIDLFALRKDRARGLWCGGRGRGYECVLLAIGVEITPACAVG
jgi:hypothetical protein